MVTKYPPVLFSQLLAVEDGEMSQTGISIIQLRDIYSTGLSTTTKQNIKGCIVACYET